MKNTKEEKDKGGCIAWVLDQEQKYADKVGLFYALLNAFLNVF